MLVQTNQSGEAVALHLVRPWDKGLNQNVGITLAAAALVGTLILVMPSTLGLTSYLPTFLHDDFFTRL
jgi:hypothetical protein